MMQLRDGVTHPAVMRCDKGMEKRGQHFVASAGSFPHAGQWSHPSKYLTSIMSWLFQVLDWCRIAVKDEALMGSAQLSPAFLKLVETS